MSTYFWKKFNILLFTMVCLSAQLFAQKDTTQKVVPEDRSHFIFSAGLSYQKQLVGEVGVIYGFSARGGSCNPGGLGGIKIATEFNFNNKDFFIGPKICAELDVLIFGARLSLIDYTDFTYHDLKLTPEIGLSLSGMVNLFYGHNYSLTDKRLQNISTNRLSLTFNLDKELWQW